LLAFHSVAAERRVLFADRPRDCGPAVRNRRGRHDIRLSSVCDNIPGYHLRDTKEANRGADMRLTLGPAALLVLALAATPALAQQTKRQGRTVEPITYPQPLVPPRSGRPDPSFGNRVGIDNERANGRCVVDLGYGRWEPC
jgi:hypothetical protein